MEGDAAGVDVLDELAEHVWFKLLDNERLVLLRLWLCKNTLVTRPARAPRGSRVWRWANHITLACTDMWGCEYETMRACGIESSAVDQRTTWMGAKSISMATYSGESSAYAILNESSERTRTHVIDYSEIRKHDKAVNATQF